MVATSGKVNRWLQGGLWVVIATKWIRGLEEFILELLNFIEIEIDVFI